MHEFVTFNNIKFYETNKEKLSKAQRNYMCRRIRVIGINQASIFFYLPVSKESKELLRAYINRVKSESKDAYHEILKSKKVKLVVMSNYLFYSPIAKYIHKKEKIDN